MAIGWIYLYSKYRKVRKENARLHQMLDAEKEICDICGFERRDHCGDEDETCPV